MAAMLSYAIYYALGIRRNFSVDLYRRQALGIGLVALIELALNLNNVVLSYVPPNIPSDFLYTNEGATGIALFVLFYPVLFYWIDYSVLVARRFDPMNLDTMYWSKARVILRPLIFMSGAAFVAVAIVLGILSGYPGIIAASFSSPFSGPIVTLFGVFFIILLIGVPISGIVLLPISARRTKDPQLRRQLLWFGLSAVFYLTNAALHEIYSKQSFPTAEALFIYSGFFFAFGYCLYRSAKSLVPLYSFAQEETREGPEPTGSSHGLMT